MLRAVGTGLDDDAALRSAWREHSAELNGFAARALGDSGAAEDAVQETFFRAWRAAATYDPDLGSLRTWLFSICRRVVIDSARARAARPPMAAGDQPERGSADAALEESLLAWQLDEAMRSIPERQREVLVEVVVRDRPVNEVAERLGVPAGTVHSRLFYGLRALRVVLEETGWVDGR